MQDHVFYGIAYRVNVQTSSHIAYGDALQRAIDEFNNHQRGFLSSPGGDFCGYEKLPEDYRGNFSVSTIQALSAFAEDWLEVQYLSLPAFIGDSQTASVGSPPDCYQYITLLATLIAPTSRGNISISASTRDQTTLINPN